MSKNKIGFLVIAGIVLATAGIIARKSQHTPPSQGLTLMISGEFATNSDGIRSAQITSVESEPARVKDGIYEVTYVTGNYSIKTGPTFHFGLYSPETGDDWTVLTPKTFTFKDKTFFAEGYKVKVSKGGTYLEVIADARRGRGYKGPYMTEPDWIKPISSK